MAKKQHLDNVNFNLIRYSNVWEDANILGKGLDIQPDSNVLSIASAGDNALALLYYKPKRVIAVDLNKVQLWLTELKLKAVQHLPLAQTEILLGYVPGDVHAIYHSIKDSLSEEAKIYWDDFMARNESSVLDAGKFERYLRGFANKILPYIHSSSAVEELFRPKSAAEQRQYYNKKWHSLRWSFFFRIFFSKRVMGLFGRDPAFLKEVEKRVGLSIMKRAAQHMKTVEAQSNPILRYCLTGSFGDARPFFLQTDTYPIIQSQIERLHLFEGYAQDAAKKFGKFDRFNLSNIFEYMDKKTFEHTAKNLIEIGESGAIYAYWNLLVHRVMSESFPTILRSDPLGAALKKEDQGFFYQRFQIDCHR